MRGFFFLPVLIVVCFIALFGSFFAYKPLLRKYNGIMGPGKAYFVTCGLLLVVAVIVSLVQAGINGSKVSAGEVILTIVIALLAAAYIAYLMIAKCTTVAQRIFLPFAAVFIAFGWSWRFLGAIFLKIPMNSDIGKEKKTVFPEYLTSPEGDSFRKVYEGSETADYECGKTGARVQFRDVDFDEGYPTGWR